MTNSHTDKHNRQRKKKHFKKALTKNQLPRLCSCSVWRSRKPPKESCASLFNPALEPRSKTATVGRPGGDTALQKQNPSLPANTTIPIDTECERIASHFQTEINFYNCQNRRVWEAGQVEKKGCVTYCCILAQNNMRTWNRLAKKKTQGASLAWKKKILKLNVAPLPPFVPKFLEFLWGVELCAPPSIKLRNCHLVDWHTAVLGMRLACPPPFVLNVIAGYQLEMGAKPQSSGSRASLVQSRSSVCRSRSKNVCRLTKQSPKSC